MQQNKNDRVFIDESSVFFSLAAFTEPYEYFYSEQTANTLASYNSYFTSGGSNPGFKVGVMCILSASQQNIKTKWNIYAFYQLIRTSTIL